MPVSLDRDSVRRRLESVDLRALFIGELGWDHGGADIAAVVAGRTFVLEAIAHKRGLVAYQYVADSNDAFPDHPVRQRIERTVARSVREHLIVYATSDRNTQCWQWVKREAGRPDRIRTHIYNGGQSGEALIQKIEQLAFSLEDEDELTIVDVSRPGPRGLRRREGHQAILRPLQERASCVPGLHRGHQERGRPRMVRLADAQPDDVHLLHPETRLSRRR